ncbi:DUF6099 family protein [Streptomyces sp. NBC_01476]|uniref:DUF6099 family protein n=1 Tax=Streptomyces sp. NBC_01476 TaxID=2903881 RepID=UPI002E2ECA2A|nr:DUF6099 family protein [Streptomyces sp. NBC_01476]
MDATRLITEAERALRSDPQPEHVIAEAWQACELTEAISHLLGDSHAQPVARAGPAPTITTTGAGPPRAARLTAVRDRAATLRALRTLLGEISLTLVGVTRTAEDETAYWNCIEALDAVDEAKDRIKELTSQGGD